MSEIATLFERIKEIVEELKQGEGEEYKLYFSPYSNGYSSDDFLFLSEVSEDGKLAQKYFAEAGEFARIANNIPRSTRGIWNLSGENKDLLYTNYSVIIDLLSELNPSKEHLPKFYDHELYAKALEQIDPNETKSYKQFLELFTQSKSRLDQLKEIDANSLEAIILEESLASIEQKWIETGYKEEVENKLLAIFQSEASRFRKNRTAAIDKYSELTQSAFNESAFPFTGCIPNNLYDWDKLSWQKIRISKSEIIELMKNPQFDYEAILGDSQVKDLELEEITCELLFCKITRHWFDEQLLTSPFWDLSLLDNTITNIPAYPTELIFARKIDITLKSRSTKNEQILKSISAFPEGKTGQFVLKKAAINSIANRIKVPSSLINFMTKVELKTKTIELFFTTSTGNPVIPDALVFSRNGKPIKVRYTSQQDRVSAAIPEGDSVSVEFSKSGFKTEAFQVDLASKVGQYRFSVSGEGRRAFDHQGNFQRVTIKFVVKNDPNMTVDTENTHIFLDGKNYSSTGYRSSDHNSLTLALRLTASSNYELKIPDNDVFIQSTFNLQFSPTEVASNVIERTVELEKKPTIVKFPLLSEGEFRMLGVVCKQLPSIPNPLYSVY